MTVEEPRLVAVAAAASSAVPSTTTVMVTAVEVAIGVATVTGWPIAVANDEVSALVKEADSVAFALRLSAAPTGMVTTKVTSVL